MMGLEKYARRAAYSLFMWRDRYRGVMAHKKDFRRFVKEDYETIISQSFAKLKRILHHAYDSSPYYQEIFDAVGLGKSEIRVPDDLHRLPLMTKDVLEVNRERLVSIRLEKAQLEISYTGGTTGTHSSFYRDRDCTAARIGRQLAILEMCGYRVGDRCALVWGAHEDLADENALPNFKRKLRKFASGKETLPCTVMSDEKMLDFHKRLNQFRPTVIYGYPNAIAQFARFVKEKGLDQIQVSTVICTAERLTSWQRNLMKEVFGGEVFDLYCTREHGCVGFECKQHNGFHVDLGSVYVEVVSSAGHVAPGEPGDIVITDLLNYGMPLIRNRIGDRCTLSQARCSCGCQLPLISKFEGRVTDLLYRPDGSTVAGVMLVDMFFDLPEISALQVVQEKLGEINLFLEVTHSYDKEVECKALQEVKQYMGQETKIHIRVVPAIERNPVSGKFQEVICKLSPTGICDGTS